MRDIILCGLIVCFLRQRMVFGTIPSEGTESTSTVCYGKDSTLSASCIASRIAITGYYHGFKLDSADCSTDDSCCDYVDSTDCLEAVTNDPTQVDDFSGRPDGTSATSNIARQSCNISYSTTSTFNLLKYQCIDQTRISDMCTPVNNAISTPGKPQYLWNINYPNSGILPADTSCGCSAESSSFTSDITLYIIHMDLYNDPTNCQQNITVSGGNSSVLHIFQCETPEFNTIQTVTVQGPYITINMANAHTLTGGKFWIGAEATDTSASIAINCPASPIADCDTPASGEHSTVTIQGTIYSSVAEYTCIEDYVYALGNSQRYCLEDGQWNGTALVCVYECGSPPSPGNGSVIHNSNVTNGQATYSCNQGFTLAGNMHRTCIGGSGWNGTIPLCHPDCGTPANGEHSTVTTQGTIYSSIAEYTCIEGYVYVFGNSLRYCLEDGQWNGTALVCFYECESPPSPENGSVIHNSNVTNGQATYSCNEGFTLAGNMHRTCINGSGWNGTLPLCHPDCDRPDTGHHSEVSMQADYSYGIVVEYTCEANYIRDSGYETRQCVENGRWNGTALSCIYECGIPPSPGNGSVTASSKLTNGQATYTCDEGFTMTGNIHRVCIEGSGWNGTLPVCHPDCDIPDTGSHSTVPTTAGFPYGTIVNTTCEANYTRESGDATRHCGENGRWNGTALSCIYECGGPPSPENGSVTANSNVTNGQARYTCDEGFTISGNMFRVCIEGSGWNGTLPVCHPDCGIPDTGSHSTVPTTPDSPYGTIVNTTCEANYTRESGDETRHCGENGQWNGTALSCIYECGGPPSPENGIVTANSNVTNGQATYTCDEGFTIAGNMFRVCIEGSGWNGTLPVCHPDCGIADTDSHSTVPTTADSPYGTIVNTTCEANYTRESGDETRHCGENGQWNGTALSCIYECGGPPSPENGLVTTNSNVTNGQATYTCDEGFTIAGNMLRVCIEGSGWNGTLPVCHPDCGIPDTDSHSTVPTTADSPYGTIVNTTCEANYTRESGDETRHCGENGQWNGTALSCIYECGGPPSPENGSVTANSNVTNGQATYTCDEGFTIAGNMFRVCIEGSGWNGTLPVCHPDCGIPDTGSHSTVPTSADSPYGTIVNTTCEANYTRESGDETRNCGENGQWNGTALSCVYACGSPPSPDNGSVAASSNVTNGQGTYTCDEGFTLTGNMFRVCIDGSGWNGTLPVCHPDCEQLDNITNGYVEMTTATFESTVIYTCDSDYFISSGSSERTCMETGVWNGSEPKCSLMECGHLSQNTNIDVILSAGYFNGSVATFECKPGYDISDDFSLLCLNDVWNGTSPNCTIKDCSSPSNGPTTNVTTPSGTTYGSIANHSCIENYSEDSGNFIRVCTKDGEWNGTVPVCIFDCGELQDPINGSVSHNSTVLDSKAVYACDTGYSLNGEHIRTCINGTGWSGTSPVCYKDCSSPSNGPTTSVSTPSGTISGSIAQYSCIESYSEESGDFLRFCTKDGEWNGTDPICVYDCGYLPDPVNGSVSYNSTIVDSTAVYTCANGYSLNGEDTRTCINTTGWSGSSPVCYKDCDPLTNGDQSTVTLSGTGYGSIAEYTCTEGYVYQSGDIQRHCLQDGLWNGTVLACVYECGTLPDLANGSVVYDTTVTDGQANFSCDSNFTLFGDPTRVCINGSGWNGTSPQCYPDCDHPDNGIHSTVSTGMNTSYGSQAEYTCLDNYTREDGDESRQCVANGQWNGTALVCVHVDCGSPPNVTHGIITYVNTTVDSIAKYTCEEGFQISRGSAFRTCTGNGGWDGSEITCTIRNCGFVEKPINGDITSKANTTVGDRVTFSCRDGFDLRGTDTIECLPNGQWSDSVPICEATNELITTTIIAVTVIVVVLISFGLLGAFGMTFCSGKTGAAPPTAQATPFREMAMTYNGSPGGQFGVMTSKF